MSESMQPIETGYQALRLEREGAIDWLCLHRPDRLNAMDGRMCDELQDYFGALSTRHATRVVVLRGAGRAFCRATISRRPRR